MSDFTLVKLTEVEDAAAKHGAGEIGAARFARTHLNATQTGVALHQMNPGMRQGFGHSHKEAEEVYVVISGSGRVKLDDEIIDLGPMDALRVAPSVVRRFEAGSEGLDILVFGQHFERDGELFPEFWAE